jgi:hypothetical protein
MTEAELALRYYAKLRERHSMHAEIADMTVKARSYLFKTKAAFGAYMYLVGYSGGLEDSKKPCACEGVEDLLAWIDPTEEWDGVAAQCRRCRREVSIPTVKELEEVDEENDINSGPAAAGPPDGTGDPTGLH